MKAKDKKKALPPETTEKAGVNQSYDELLKWIADKPRNFGWGAVVSYDREQTNKVLAQQYIEKYSEDNFIKPLGTLVPDNDNKNATQIVDYTFDAPRLSFEGSTLLNGRANLTLGVVGGAQLYWSKDADGYWHISKVSELDVLDGQRLTSTVLLTDSNGGSVADNGTVSLDVSKGSEYQLAEMTTELERKRVGEALHRALAIQPPKQTTFELGKVLPVDADPIIDPEYFKIAVYEKDPGTSIYSDDYGNGVVVLFIKMRGSKEPGTLPVETEQIGYLLPADNSSSILLNYNLLIKGAIEKGMKDLSDGSYNIEDRAEYGKERLRFTSGYAGGGVVDFTSPVDEITFAEGSCCYVDYTLGWEYGENYPSPEQFKHDYAGMFEVNWGDANEIVIDGVTLKGTQVGFWGVMYENPDLPNSGRIKLIGLPGTGYTGYIPYYVTRVLYQSLQFIIDKDENGHPSIQAVFDELQDLEAYEYTANPEWYLVSSAYDELLHYAVGDVENIKRLLSGCFKLMLKNFEMPFDKLKNELKEAIARIELFRLNGLLFSNGDVVTLDKVATPSDMFITGNIGERYDGFAVTPLEPVLGAGKTQQFSIITDDPTQFTVNWTLKSVTDGAEPGTIDANGLYTAPAADNVKSTGNRVIITATDDVNKVSSSALLTVVKRDLTVNPLLMECGASPSSYTVSAGAIDDGALSFSVENLRGDIPGTLTAKSTGEGYSYVAGTIGKDADGKAKRTNITLDRLTFTNAAGNKGESYALNILANLSDSLRIDYTKLGDISDGTPIKSIPVMVVFQGLDGTVESRPGDEYWNDFEFEVVYGNGTFDKSKGEYTLADNSSERFAIIKSFYLDGRSFTEGCLIIPLPLVNLPELVRFNMNIDAEVSRYTEMVESASDRNNIDNYVKGRVKRGRRVI